MMKKTTTLITAVFLAWSCGHFLAAPWMGKSNADFIQAVEKRQPIGFPGFAKHSNLVNRYFYQRFSEALSDHLVFRSALIVLKRNMDYLIFNRRDYNFIDIGKSGWFFIRDAYFLKNETPEGMRRVLGRIDYFLKNYPGNEPEFLLVVPPDKHSIYPEMLSVQCEKHIEKGNRRGEKVRRFLEDHPSDRVLPLWKAYLNKKQTASERMFFKTDTHHTPTGALIMCREIVEKIYPGIWRDDEVVHKGKKQLCGDLTLMMGMNRKKETVNDWGVNRKGVEKISKDYLEAERGVKGFLRYVSKSQEQPMITGKTLVLHDSMMANSREALRQFFTDVTFVHYERAYGEERFEELTGKHDRIILEIAERMTMQTMDNLLDGYHYEMLHEMTEEDLKNSFYNKEMTLKAEKNGVHITVLGNDPIIYLPTQHLDYDGEYQVSVKMDSNVTTDSQLFYLDDEHQNFFQEHSRIKPVILGTNYLNFNLPADSFWYPKRFDPSMRPGDFVIKAIMVRRLSGKQNGAGTPCVGRKAWIHAIVVPENAEVVIPVWDSMAEGNTNSRCKIIPRGMLVYAEQDDPFFILPPIPGIATDSRPVLVLELDVPKGSVCQVFYKQSHTADYTENLSQQKPVHSGFNLLRFELEPGILPYSLRIDPGTQKGRYLIRSARIEGIAKGADNAKGHTVHMIYPSVPVKSVLLEKLGEIIVPEQEVEVRETPGSMELNSLSNDPIIYFSPRMEWIKSGYYKVVIALEASRVTIAQLFWRAKDSQEYNEITSRRYRVVSGENRLEFVVPAIAFEQPLRFDFASNTGIYKMKTLKIERIILLDGQDENRRQHVSE